MPPVSREGEMAAGIARSAGPRSTAARQTESIPSRLSPVLLSLYWFLITDFVNASK